MTSPELKPGGVLVVSLYAAAEDMDRLRAWYAAEKIPAILKVPGVTGVSTWETAWRYVADASGAQVAVDAPPAYTVIYELSDVDTVRSEAFLDADGRSYADVPTVDGAPLHYRTETSVTARDVARVDNPGLEAAAPPAKGMMVVSITPERDYIPLLHEWYMDVHLPELLVCPGMLGARRFQALDGIPNFFALYYLDRPEALKSPEFVQVSGRPFDQLPEIIHRLGPHMNGNICDVYRSLD
jgi:hypothetical protein